MAAAKKPCFLLFLLNLTFTYHHSKAGGLHVTANFVLV